MFDNRNAIRYINYMDDKEYEEMFKVLLENFNEEEAIMLVGMLTQEQLEALIERLKRQGTKG